MKISPKELRQDLKESPTGLQAKLRVKAYFPPEAPELAIKIFNFFRKMEKNVITAGGMSHHIMALDQYKIGEIGKRDYGIELSRYLYLFEIYENKLLKEQNREQEARN